MNTGTPTKPTTSHRIRELTRQAVEAGAEVVSFHECSISAYSFVQPFSKAELLELAEPVPDGPSTRQLVEIAREFQVPVLAGLFERDKDEGGILQVYNTYLCVDQHRAAREVSQAARLCESASEIWG